ncbi:MAG: serine/threonine-protein phosphatase [Bryobacterales bacterium]|nr:serine/threonine-protein phosphatase [Bryobacterales bacterium]
MLKSYGLTDPGCIRTNNEDRFLTAPELGLFLVADGMGGARAGEHASQLAVDTVVGRIRSSGRRDAQALLAALEEANRIVMEAGQREAGKQGMGTTLVAALDTGRELAIASVGDSRAYLLAGGSLNAVTEDQTWVQDVGRSLGLDEISLRAHPLRHVLTMAIGAGAPLVVRCYNIVFDSGALLLLSSDGLHGVLDRDRMQHILAGEGSLEDKCRALVEAARAAGGPDNITAVLVQRE